MLENLSIIAVFVIVIGLIVGVLFFKGRKNKKDSEFFQTSEEISVAFTDRVREKRKY